MIPENKFKQIQEAIANGSRVGKAVRGAGFQPFEYYDARRKFLKTKPKPKKNKQPEYTAIPIGDSGGILELKVDAKTLAELVRLIGVFRNGN